MKDNVMNVKGEKRTIDFNDENDFIVKYNSTLDSDGDGYFLTDQVCDSFISQCVHVSDIR